MKNFGNSKNEKTDLTIEELRGIPGYENIAEQDAIRILYSIKELSVIIFFTARKNNLERK